MRSALFALLLLAAAPLEAGFEEVVAADAAFDLDAARRVALDLLAADSGGADAVATAGWWLDSLPLLAEPEAVLAAVGPERDPEVGFFLARLEGSLAEAPPAGALAAADLAGPFGVHDRLDLERGVVPADADLPPLPTPWRGQTEPFHLHLRSLDGWLAPPEGMAVGGVYLVGYSFAVAAPTSAWLVVECEGSFDLELGGRPAARARVCGELSPTASWYRVRLEAGGHRLRLAISSREVPRVRVSLLDDDGAPLVTSPPEGAERAAASLTAEEPPAAASLARHIAEAPAEVGWLLLEAAVARGRGDPQRARAALERAAAADRDDPRVHLELARFFLTAPTGSDPEVDYRRAQEHIRRTGSIPLQLLLEHELARRQRRQEDREQALDRLVRERGGDARVLLEWTREAVRRRWPREAEESLEALERRLGRSSAVADLRLEVLTALDRLGERNQLLRALTAREPPQPSRVEQLAAACERDLARSTLDRLRARVDNPELDRTAVRLALEGGDREGARRELERARARWGSLPDSRGRLSPSPPGSRGGSPAPSPSCSRSTPPTSALRLSVGDSAANRSTPRSASTPWRSPASRPRRRPRSTPSSCSTRRWSGCIRTAPACTTTTASPAP